ncbi:MAG: hypothetical protein Q8O67_15785 [Deltaproteobacteria bacterium]|nr:hypothetical protein [Deltaproteobacteria bacterium]
MISAVGQQQLSTLVQKQGRSGLEDLVKKSDVAGLKQAGLSEIDARAVLAESQSKGFDFVFGLAQALTKLGGPANQSGAGQKGVSEAGGKKGAEAPSTGNTNPMLAARGGILDGVDVAKVKQFNLRGLSLPKEIVKIADEAFAGRSTRAQFSGYSAPPAGTKYAENTAAFVGAFADKLGTGNVGLITSPTADNGSIDAITTMTGQDKKVPVLSITAKGYVDYIDPKKFPPGIDTAAYESAPKYVFGSGEKYNQATALASNAFVATGGRDVTVFDFMRAIEKGNPAVLVVDQGVSSALGDKAIWDKDKNRVNNGAAYLAEQIGSYLQTGTLPHADVAKEGFGAFNKDWLDAHKEALGKLVKTVGIDAAGSPESINAAAADAAAFVGKFTSPTTSALSQTSVADIKGSFQPAYAKHSASFAALSADQLKAATSKVPGAVVHMANAAKLLSDVATKTAAHFSTGKFSGLDDAKMNESAVKQHAGYVAGELGRKLDINPDMARDVLVPFYLSTMGGASPEQRADLASKLQSGQVKHDSDSGRELAPKMAAIKAFVTDANNGWMFNEYGFGDTDKALNRPGVYAGQAVLDFATSIAGTPNKAKALLERALNRSAADLGKALENPTSTEDMLAQFAARAAQTGWLVSKGGQGIVEANHADPKKAEKGVARFAPKNDLMTDFNSLAAKKGWAEVAKDIDQVKTALQGAGVLN